STWTVPNETAIVQKSPDGAIPCSKSWSCWLVGSSTAPVNKSIHMKPNDPMCGRLSAPTYNPCMNRMSQSKTYVDPSLPCPLPRVSDPPTTPTKSVLVDI